MGWTYPTQSTEYVGPFGADRAADARDVRAADGDVGRQCLLVLKGCVQHVKLTVLGVYNTCSFLPWVCTTRAADRLGCADRAADARDVRAADGHSGLLARATHGALSLSRTHSLTLALSLFLSLSHTHTHTHFYTNTQTLARPAHGIPEPPILCTRTLATRNRKRSCG